MVHTLKFLQTNTDQIYIPVRMFAVTELNFLNILPDKLYTYLNA